MQAIPAETLADALARLPLDVLLFKPEQQERFEVWGTSTLGELAALPELDLIARMGQPGKLLRLRARGELPHLLLPVEESLTLSEVMDFEEPVETQEPLLFCINPMLEHLIVRAQSHAYALAAVTFSLCLYQNADRDLVVPDAKNEEAPLSAQATNEPSSTPYPAFALRTTAPQHPRKELPSRATHHQL